MTCEVSLGEYDGDTPKVFESSFKVARKQHTCYECRDSIAEGQRHEVVTGLWGDRWETYRFCEPCSEASREFYDGARTFGALWNEMGNEWDEGAHVQACVNRLTTVAAKAHMLRQWRRWKGLEA